MSAGSVDDDAEPGYLRARVLRYWVCLELKNEDGPLTVAELVLRLEVRGLRVKGRPSKAVSDTLRWADHRGWARRVRRGTYGPGRIPQQTAAYMQEVVSLSIRSGDPLIARAIARRAG